MAVKSLTRGGGRRPTARSVVAALTRAGSARTRDGMARYGITTVNALGVPLPTIQRLAKEIGTNHELAGELWETGIYEARMMASFIADPAQLTASQMDRWCRDFDNWAICDTLCFQLFDKSLRALSKIRQWERRRREFERRAAFALLASVALHDRRLDDETFVDLLPLIEQAADDERNFVRKGVSWALRSIGHRSPALLDASLHVARRMAGSVNSTTRWVGKDALRDLERPSIRARAVRNEARREGKRPKGAAQRSRTRSRK